MKIGGYSDVDVQFAKKHSNQPDPSESDDDCFDQMMNDD